MQGRRRLVAGSRTAYRRYLRKFICVIPRVYGGYFESSSRVIQRYFIGQTIPVLVSCLADLEVGLEAEASVSQKDRRWAVFSVGRHFEDYSSSVQMSSESYCSEGLP